LNNEVTIPNEVPVKPVLPLASQGKLFSHHRFIYLFIDLFISDRLIARNS